MSLAGLSGLTGLRGLVRQQPNVGGGFGFSSGFTTGFDS